MGETLACHPKLRALPNAIVVSAMWENEADIIYLLHGFLESSVYQNE